MGVKGSDVLLIRGLKLKQGNKVHIITMQICLLNAKYLRIRCHRPGDGMTGNYLVNYIILLSRLKHTCELIK